MNPMDISYTVWKSTQAASSATVYYMTDNDATRYKLFIVLTAGAPKTVRGSFRHDIDRKGSPVDAADFETLYKPTAVLIANPNDAVALAIS